MNRHKILMVALPLFVFSVVHAQQRKPKADVWQMHDPASDAIFYLNTGQAEREMDPKLWNRIKNDKRQSAKAKADDDDFALELFEKDVELLANFYVVSNEPLRLAVVGSMSYAESEQHVLSNIVVMVSEMIGEGGGKCVRSGTKRNPIYDMRLQNESDDDVGLKIEQAESGFAKFTFLYNLEQLPKRTSVPGAQPSLLRAASRIRGGDTALGVALNTPAWAWLFSGKGKDMRVMRRLFRAMKVGEVRIRVLGHNIEAELNGEFKSPVLAKRYSTDLLEELPKVEQTLKGGVLAGLKPNVDGSSVSISAKARLDLAWESMMSMNANMSSMTTNSPTASSVEVE